MQKGTSYSRVGIALPVAHKTGDSLNDWEGRVLLIDEYGASAAGDYLWTWDPAEKMFQRLPAWSTEHDVKLQEVQVVLPEQNTSNTVLAPLATIIERHRFAKSLKFSSIPHVMHNATWDEQYESAQCVWITRASVQPEKQSWDSLQSVHASLKSSLKFEPVGRDADHLKAAAVARHAWEQGLNVVVGDEHQMKKADHRYLLPHLTATALEHGWEGARVKEWRKFGVISYDRAALHESQDDEEGVRDASIIGMIINSDNRENIEGEEAHKEGGDDMDEEDEGAATSGDDDNDETMDKLLASVREHHEEIMNDYDLWLQCD